MCIYIAAFDVEFYFLINLYFFGISVTRLVFTLIDLGYNPKYYNVLNTYSKNLKISSTQLSTTCIFHFNIRATRQFLEAVLPFFINFFSDLGCHPTSRCIFILIRPKWTFPSHGVFLNYFVVISETFPSVKFYIIIPANILFFFK